MVGNLRRDVNSVVIPNPNLGLAGEFEHDHYFRKVLHELPAAIYTTDAQGHITYYNDAAKELWGHAPPLGTSEWCGSWKLFWPDGTALPHGDCPMAIAIKERRSVRGIEAIAERPDGTRIPFIPYPTPLFDRSGTLIGAVNMLVDISDRKRAEEALQELAAIVESSHDAIVSKDLSGTISSWNRAAEQLFGYSADEVVGKSILMLIPADRQDEERQIIERIKRGEKVEHYETMRRRKNGSLVPLSITVSPVRDSRNKIIGASKIARDITERKRAEEQRAVLLGEMKHRTKNFVAIIDAIARQTRPANDPGAAATLDGFVARLNALLLTGELVVDSLDRRAELKALFERALQPFVDPTRPASIHLDGPEIKVAENTAGNLALAVHELATNALKYGALKSPLGRVSITWTKDESDRVVIEWKETGGDPILTVPTRKGFGHRVISLATSAEPNGKTSMRFERDGLRCGFEFQQ
jgi:PAS domain S-box-containing protein